MITVHVKTKKVVSHNAQNESVYETIVQKIGPEATFNKFAKLLPNQGYASAEVIKVIEDGKEVDLIEKYQSMLDIKPKIQDEKIDYKGLAEKQGKLLEEMEARLKALEGDSKSEDRIKLESKANELEINFRANIGDSKLLEKIQEKEPEFTL